MVALVVVRERENDWQRATRRYPKRLRQTKRSGDEAYYLHDQLSLILRVASQFAGTKYQELMAPVPAARLSRGLSLLSR